MGGVGEGDLRGYSTEGVRLRMGSSGTVLWREDHESTRVWQHDGNFEVDECVVRVSISSTSQYHRYLFHPLSIS